MAVNSILPPYPIFADASGEPLEGGYIYVGEPGFEARSTPKTSFYDKLLTVPTGTASGAAVRTTAGFPARNGSPAMIYADEDYSLTVTDKNGRVIYTTLNRTFAFGVEVADIAPILAPDGNFTNTGFGFINEQNTGRVRSGTGVVQDVVQGALVSQQSAAGTVFTLPVSGAGFVAGVTAALNALLTAITGLSSNGLMVRTSATTVAARSVTSTNGSVTVTNGDGVAGNINLSVSSAWVEVAGSPFTVSGASPFNITSGLNYRDLMIVGLQTTATVTGLRQIRVGNSGGFLATAIYEETEGAAGTEIGLSASATLARGFVLQIFGFNTTSAIKPLMMHSSRVSGDDAMAIADASVFDRIQLLNSAAATLGGTLRVYGRG